MIIAMSGSFAKPKYETSTLLKMRTKCRLYWAVSSPFVALLAVAIGAIEAFMAYVQSPMRLDFVQSLKELGMPVLPYGYEFFEALGSGKAEFVEG